MSNDLDPDNWITRTAAAERYGVSLRTLDRLAAAGEVERVKLPRRLPSSFLSVDDLDRVLAAEVSQ